MTNPFLLLLMSLLSTSLMAQEKVIRKFYKDYEEVKDSSMANKYCDFILNKKKKSRGKYIQYTINGIKEEECECSNAIKKEKEGTCIYYYENESIKAIVTFKENKWNGVIKSYYENGQLKREDEYKDGAFVSGKCYTSSGADTAHFPYYKIAEPVGGFAELNRYIAANFKYPEEARRKKVQGKVFVGFTIDYDGSIIDVKVLKGVHEVLDEEALRVVKTLPKFNPGLSEGRPDRMHFIVPVNARLQ